MHSNVFIIIVFCGLAASCCSFRGGGTFPGTLEVSKEVSLSELSHYYNEQTNGLIKYVLLNSERFDTTMKFVWDPYYKKRILPDSNLSVEVLQELFEFDEKRFVNESGQEDFLSATYQFYRSQPYDSKRQTYERPYRYLSAWGCLFFPPIKKLRQSLPFYHSKFTCDFNPKTVTSRYFDPEFQKQLDEETQTELTYGNKLRALFNGSESFPQKLRLTAEAKKFLYIAVMTMVADETGRELVRNMVNAKRNGVDVRLITEGSYALSISNYCIGVLEREGIPVVRVDDKSLSHLDRMFHNKIWIRDGEEAILGGMNVLNYQNKSDGFNFLNRDTDILVQGPAVTSLLESFIELWKKYDTELRPIALGEYTLATRLASERAEGVRGSENYARWLGNPETRMNGICRTAVQGNNAEPQKIVMLLLRYLEEAQHSFYVTNPEIEFDLDRKMEYIDMLAELMQNKASNPDFYLAYITNGFDGGLGEKNIFIRRSVRDANLLGENFWEDMLTPLVDEDGHDVNQRVRRAIHPLIQVGVHGFQYFNYIHAKEFYFDRLLVGIGSWNFDGFSANNNHECIIFCLDENLRLQIEHQMVLDMVNSVPIIR
ncbi:MAG: phosphatidylserine/phosphatidylglycerophosphate/cardiolipin synthase family protein [Ignavibacteriaceae bacterium]